MHRVLVALSCVIFAIGINNVFPTLATTINEDAVELSRLAEELWSLTPAVLQNQGPLALCQVIKECCSSEDRSKAISLMVSSITDVNRTEIHYAKVIDVCINSTALHIASQSCPSLNILFSSLKKKQDKSDTEQHRRIIMKNRVELNNLIRLMNEECNVEEVHALLCMSHMKLVNMCANKILQTIYSGSDYQSYQEYIEETKLTFSNLNQKLSRILLKNTKRF